MKELFARWRRIIDSLLGPDAVSPRAQKIILVLVLLACFTVRVATIQAPAIDRTNWKEIDYIEISEDYWKHGFDFFMPELSWPAEPPRATAMEFPLVPYAVSFLYPVFGMNAYSVRAITLLAFLLMSFYVFRLVRRELGPIVGLLAAFASCTMPLYHPHGNSLCSEPVMIAASVMSIFHFAEWVDFKRRRDWVVAMVSFSLSVGLKIYPLYLLLPLAWCVFRKHRWHLPAYRSLALLLGCSLLLPAAWYSYDYYLKVNYADFFNMDSRKFEIAAMLTNPIWYRVMYERVASILGGKIGTGLSVIGFMVALFSRKAGLILSYFASVVCFFLVAAQSNLGSITQQLAIIPPLSVFVALGAVGLVVSGVLALCLIDRWVILNPRRVLICLLASLVLISMIGVRRHKEIVRSDVVTAVHAERWEMAQVIRKYCDSESKLVTAGEYAVYHKGKSDLSTILYYYTGLQGWSFHNKEWSCKRIKALRQKGATHFVALEPYRSPISPPDDGELWRFVEEMEKKYKVLYENRDKHMVLLDLREPALN